MANLLKTLVLSLTIVGAGAFTVAAHAETTQSNHAQEGVEDAAKNMKKAGRDVKDKGCEMINGKMQCAGKKAMSKARNAKDEIKDKANDTETK